MPPAMTVLLSTSLTSDAVARFRAGSAARGNNGFGNGGGDGSNAGFQDGAASMATAVITVAAGGLPVTDVTATAPTRGMAVTEAIAAGGIKWGMPVTKVSNGVPVTFIVISTIGKGPE